MSDGQLVGLVGCRRDRSMPALDAENLADFQCNLPAFIGMDSNGASSK